MKLNNDAPDKQTFELTRELNAPIQLVWQAWSTPESLAKWWGPKGFYIDVKSHEFKPGGTVHYSMTSPEGDMMWGKFTFRDLEEPRKIVFNNAFSDPEGNIQPNPFLPVWPLQIVNTITLTENHGKTILHLSARPLEANEEEYAGFVDLFDSMNGGYNGTFDQLETYLSVLNP